MLGSAEMEFEAFVAREGGRLLRFAVLLTGNRQDAEDLVQLTLLRAAGRWTAARQKPEGYARTVLVNLARDRWRASRRGTESAAADLDGQPAGGDGVSAVLDRELLLRACRLLPVQQRAVLVLRYWEDRSIDDTAALLGCSAGTVKSHTHRALARLRQALAEEAGPDEGTARQGGTAARGAQILPIRGDREEAPC